MVDRRPLALLFDLDGTLVDSIELILASFRHTFATHLGDVPPDAKWIAGLGTPLFTQLREFTQDDAIARAMTATYRAYQLERHDELMRAYPAVRETMAELRSRRHPTALVTSKMTRPRRARPHLHRPARHDRHRDRHGGHEAPQARPGAGAPRPRLPRLPARGGRVPGRLAARHRGGNAAGVITVAAQWGPFSAAELNAARPTHQIARMKDLPALVSRLGSPR